MDYVATSPSRTIKRSSGIDFALDHSGGQLLYRQIYHRFKDAILQGSFPAGARVPSIRTLACELQVSRNTVEKAFDLLVGEGFLVSNGQSGTTTTSIIANDDFAPPVVTTLPGGLVPRPFQLGVPALDAFPVVTWQTLSQRVLRSRQETSHVADDVQGHLALRQSIAAYLNVSRGISCHAGQVIVTQGYRQSLTLLASGLLVPGDAVWTEDPVFPPARRLLERLRMQMVPVPTDLAGIDVSAGLLRAPLARMALLTPANQSPTGAVLSLQRRSELLAWAAQNDAWLVEDDYDSEFCAEGRQQPTLCSLDRQGRTFYLGTFSKALHPSLRMAYVVVPPAMMAPMREACRDLLDGGPLIVQKTLSTFMAEGHFGRHLKRMRSLYTKRREMMVDALNAHLGDRLAVSSWSRGLSVLAFIKGPAHDIDVARRADAAGLSVGALSSRALERDCGQGLLLGFANFADRTAVTRAVRTLASCF